MRNKFYAQEWARMIADNYFANGLSWSSERLVIELELLGYNLAREGRTEEARAVFIAVSELTKEAKSFGTD